MSSFNKILQITAAEAPGQAWRYQFGDRQRADLLSCKECIKLDVRYVRRWSLWLDMENIIRTFWAVLVTSKGIYGADGINDDFMPRSSVTRECSR